MKFGVNQVRKFGTNDGAYSIVTDRENYDSQITLTDYETDIVLLHFGKENLHIGNVQANKAKAKKEFRLYPGGDPVFLNVVYPKPEKTELRLYLSQRAGFKPDGGDVGFIFRKDGALWIGFMPELNWRRECSILKQDAFDEDYQSSVNDTVEPPQIVTLKERGVYRRDRRIALKRMELSGYQCECDPEHEIFISRFTKKPYLEAHHLIPMGMQSDFAGSLDIVDNIFCLCPFCHRAVHHATEREARNILGNLVARRAMLDQFNLGINDLFSLYAVEEID